jgi:hypothetical protein
MHLSSRHLYGRVLALTMAVVLLLAAQSTAASMIIHMGNDAALKWIWTSKPGLSGALYELVTSAEQAQKVLGRLPKHLQSDAFKGIDFQRQAAIVAYLGEAPRGGYAVDIHSVQISGSQVWINITRRAPGADEITTMALTYPLAVKAIPLTDLPAKPYEVRFVDQNDVLLAQTTVGNRVPASTTLVLGKKSMLRWQWTRDKELPGALYALVTSRSQANRVASMLPEKLGKDAFRDINFKKEVAVVAYLGNASRNGYAVGIHSVEVTGQQVRVTVGRRSRSTSKTVMKSAPRLFEVKSFSRTVLPKEAFTVQFVDQDATPLPQTYFVTLP